ncbi:MAG TPA: hypothetical protein VFJ91_05315 [Gaiellaceae bacterium]|nr:hypothetical protein [Gaiellaceae bacterium]
MSRIPQSGRRALAAIVIAAAALVIGAVFGSAGSGRAAATAAPVNTGTPTISGVAQEGQTLTASDGTWNNSPTSYTYAWSRCNANGDSCATISGATLKTYQLVAADVAHTVRVTVTAKNADGSADATSAPSAVVASAAAPKNTALPAISGTVAVGEILTVSNGAWSGSPTGYAYAWSRCDANGNACATISGADGPQYKLTAADAGTTVRATVTAKNATGQTAATSAQTAVVPTPSTPAPTGCPAGTGVVQAKDLALPARMSIGSQTVSPGVVTPSATTIQVHAKVTACGGRPVQGALVFAVPVPYNQYEGAEVATGADGTVTLTLSQRAGFPASTHQERLALFLRSRRPNGPTTGDVSTHRLVTFPVRLR